MEFIPAVAMMALVKKVFDFLRYATHGDINGVVSQLCVWVSGVVVFFLVANTAWAASIVIAGRPLSAMTFWEVLFAGVTLGSSASFAHDALIKSLDNHNSAAIPTLLPAGSRAPRPDPGPPTTG